MPSIISVYLPLYAQSHSDFIEGPFSSPQEVTSTCLTCHEDTGDEILKTRHWNWIGSKTDSSSDSAKSYGKINLINNFCIAVPSNWPRCTSCHIGYGWKDDTFDFSDKENIDCLICHDQTGKYSKVPTGAGMPPDTLDLALIAQNVGSPTIKNCGICHFDGGGGTGVKHGDMDNSLYEPSPELDIHMGGLGFGCLDCHETTAHQISGAGHGSIASGSNHFSCLKCHGEDVHEKNILNQHVSTVSCETCHIPTFAREEPTKMWWDWSEAGQDMESTPDEFGMETYNKKKGGFVWRKNVKPEYRWYNGSAKYYDIGEKIDPEQILSLNRLNGNYSDADSKITPFKVMRGKQPYDSLNKYLIVPKLFGENGYWNTFDWETASREGMKSVNLDFSGSVAFAETEMYWPINHMVAPAENAVRCTNCHGIGGKKMLDWKSLGYADDPMKVGGRKTK